MPKKSYLKCFFGCEIDGPLHRFPKPQYPHTERYNAWKSVLPASVQSKGDQYIFDQIRICYRHFEQCYSLPSRLLTRNAIPSLNIPSTSSQIPMEICSELAELEVRNKIVPQEVINVDESVPSMGYQAINKSGGKRNTFKKKESVEVTKLKLKLLKLKEKCKTKTKLIRMAKNVSMQKSFLKVMESLPENVQLFYNMQLKSKVKPRGRKYSLEEKILALTVFKQSPKAYNLMKNIFTLPSKRTLQNLLSCIEIGTGIQKDIIERLTEYVKKLPIE